MQDILNFFNPDHYGRFSADEIPENLKDHISYPLQVFKTTCIVFTIFFTLNFVIITYSIPDWLIMVLFIEAILLLVLLAFHVLLVISYVVFAITDREYSLLIAQKSSVILINIPIGIIYIKLLNCISF